MDGRFQTLNGDNLDVEKRWNKKQYRDLKSRSRQTANSTFSSLLSLKLRYENWSRGSIWRLPVVVNVLLNWLSNDSENKTANVLDLKLSGLVNILLRLKRRFCTYLLTLTSQIFSLSWYFMVGSTFVNEKSSSELSRDRKTFCCPKR